MQRSLADAVRRRARFRCEYCRAPEAESDLPFQIDHIIAHKHSGPTVLENLALACAFCNAHEGSNVGGLDSTSKTFQRLFNPRVDRWNDHFRWDGLRIVGITAMGQITVDVLEMNDNEQVSIRVALLKSGWLLRPDA